MSAGASTNVATATVTKVLSRTRDAKGVWFRHGSTTTDFYVYPQQSGDAPSFTTAEMKIPRATATADGYMVLTDDPMCNWDWYVYQASGGSVALVAGRWDAPTTS